MLTRYFMALGVLILIGLIIHNLFSRRQKRAIHEFISLFAKILLFISVLSALFLLMKRL